MFGILNINKPKGFTSQDVVSKLRKILKLKQIGHTGTLDPMATGVLIICLDKATKLIQYLDTSKAYRAFIKLGVETDTYDAEGKIINIVPVNPDLAVIKDLLKDFEGNITQIPPIYSAIHYKGKRLYEYARANIDIEDIPERKVCINSIKLVDITEIDSENPVITVDIDCSGGTYIRSIAHDLGDKLGYGASLCDLIRTKSGKLNLDQSHTLDEIEEFFKKDKINELIIDPVHEIDLKYYQIDQTQYEKIKKGQCIIDFQISEENEQNKVQLIYEGNLAAIAEVKESKIYPIRVIGV